MNRPRLVLRADADASMGAGHAMRLLALGAAWRARGGEALWAAHDPLPSLVERYQGNGIGVMRLEGRHPDPSDALATAEALTHEWKNAWLAVDGYHFDSFYLRQLKPTGAHILWLDDFGLAGGFDADIVLNQNAWHDPSWYSALPVGTTLLSGPSHMLLRPEFLRPDLQQRTIPENAAKVLVSLGGGDGGETNGTILRGLAASGIHGLATVIVSGPAATERNELATLCAQAGPGFRLETDAKDMPGLMAWADFAVLAGGTSCLEAASLGLPMLLTKTADNQIGNLRGMVLAGAALDLGAASVLTPVGVGEAAKALSADAPLRAAMSRAGRDMVDGKGTRRVMAEMLTGEVTLRPASARDRVLLFRWANDPLVRSNAFSTAPIPWEDHVRWFAMKTASAECRIFIAEHKNGTPLGQIRFDADNGNAFIDVSVDPAFRGLGLGGRILRKGVAAFKRERPDCHQAVGLVLPSNRASRGSFERAGFKPASPETMPDVPEGTIVYLSRLNGEGVLE